MFNLDEEETRENLSNCSLETIVEKATSPDPKTQLDAVQVCDHKVFSEVDRNNDLYINHF